MSRLILILFAAALFLSKALHAETYYLTVAGLGGAPEYDQRFTGWAKDLDKLLHTAEPNSKIETLMGPEATKANVTSKLRSIGGEIKPDDSLIIMMIGHGTFDNIDYKFNLPGPDMTATELGNILDKIPSKHQLIVNMTSCSGGSLVALERPNRVVITATKTGTEKNATYFTRYWIEALRDPASDSDKNESISALEAFKYAEQKTAQYFESQKRLATEHALLEDTGKGEGTKSPGPDNGEGLLAAHFTVMRLGAVAAQANNPEKLALLKKKEQLEQSIDDLKYHKASMDLAEYQQKLHDYLIELAKTQAELDK